MFTHESSKLKFVLLLMTFHKEYHSFTMYTLNVKINSSNLQGDG